MNAKLYISRMKMSQKTHFWHQNLLKITIFEKIAKPCFWSKTFWTAYKRQFWVKMLKLRENYLKTDV